MTGLKIYIVITMLIINALETQMKTKEDNMALGTLLLGIGLVLLLIWALKVLLALFLSIAESVLILGFYIVLFYGITALIVSVYAHLFPKKTPKFVKMALNFHHNIALAIKSMIKSLKNLFFGKAQKKSSH